MKTKTGVLIINLGTPDSPKVKDVRRYLYEFLNDPRVIDIPWLKRKLLVNCIIVPFRAPKSAKVYEQLWSENGSPIIYHTKNLRNKLQESLGDSYCVEMAMRYQNPSIKEGLEKLKAQKVDNIIVIPLYPQYAASTTGSTIEKVMDEVSKWWVIPEIKFVGQFFDHPDFIDAFVYRAKEYDIESYDHILFSYHGLPERHIDKVHDKGSCQDCICEKEFNEENRFCYKNTCYATTRYIAEKLELEKDRYSVSFQSRLNDKWIKPYSDEVIKELGQKGMKKVLVLSPAFVADCLETTIEIGEEYQEIFEKYGGDKVQLVESLNDHPKWVKCLKNLVNEKF